MAVTLQKSRLILPNAQDKIIKLSDGTETTLEVVKKTLKDTYRLEGGNVGQKITSLTSTFINTSFDQAFDRYNMDVGLLNVFFQKETMLLGTQIRNVYFGQVIGTEFSSDVRYHFTDVKIPDFEEKILGLYQTEYRLTLDPLNWIEFFRNPDNYLVYGSHIKKRIVDGIVNDLWGFILYFFGYDKTKLSKQLPKPFEQMCVAMKNNFTNEVIADDTGLEGFFKKIKNVGLMMQQAPDNSYLMKKKQGDENPGHPVVVSKKNMVLVLPIIDWQNFKYAKLNIYNPNFYNLDEFDQNNIFYLPIPSGTAYIFDKRCIKIIPTHKQVVVKDFANLSKDITHHVWYRGGMFTNFGGIKVKMKNNN